MNAPLETVRSQVPAAEWQVRVDLAACYRLVAHFGMSDLVYNHITARVPGQDGQFLINPYGMMYEEITASSLVRIYLDGNVLFNVDPEHFGVNRAGYVIHSAIHAARHDVDCVIHTHTRAGMAVSALACGLQPIAQTSMRFCGENLTYHDYEGVAVDLDERERLVRDLGRGDSMILRNHGLLTVGPSIGEAFNTMYWLELACRTQVDAMSCNTPLSLPSPAMVAKTHNLYRPEVRRPFGVMEWPAMLRLLDRRDPSFRD